MSLTKNNSKKKKKKTQTVIHFVPFILWCSVSWVLWISIFVPFSEQQGVAWDSPLEGDSLSRNLSEYSEPLYAVPHKEHHKFTLDDFTLHKMLGKGSFGKVGIWTQQFYYTLKTLNSFLCFFDVHCIYIWI